VARFDEGGSGEWLPLTIDNPKLKDKFSDQADILVNVRLAATELGATPMDRPEWTTVAPNGDVYCTLTNNSERTTPNAANPQAPNPHGHIIRWRDSDDHIGTSFSWDIFLLSDDHYDEEHTFASPDGLWADPDGRLFVMTDGGQREKHNNQLLVSDTNTGEIRRLLTGVAGCEVTGITATPDRRTLFVNFQHPGNGDPALSNFPHSPDQTTIPRDCTLALRRKDGGIVGS
jgi:secreted PhoX family phosphatase